MCGIAGILDLEGRSEIPRELMERMCGVLKHRGPDDEGIHREPGFALGLRRLSIIDLDTGHQPIANESGESWVVCNGEIYNFRELRSQLEERGHRFSTKSDTESILHLYEEKGVECLQDLRGMFALAVWDGRRRRLFLARDRVGKKPLCYASHKGWLVFSSEAKAILQVPGIERRVSVEALDDYLTYQYVPAPRTMFQGIMKLPPAHFMIADREGIKIERYWDLDFSAKTDLPVDDICRRILELLEESTRLRLMSDVPLGAFLSGGVDSSAVVGMMSRLMDKPVKTFSVGYTEKAYDELGYARMTARHFGTEHHEYIVRPDVMRILPVLVWHYNEPFGDSSMVPTYYVSQATRREVTVALNGDGGDECFGGYPRYRGVRLAAAYYNLPGWVRRHAVPRIIRVIPGRGDPKAFFERSRRFLRAVQAGREHYYMRWISCFDREERQALYSPDLGNLTSGRDSGEFFRTAFEASAAEDFLDRVFYADIRSYLPEDLLVKMDIASMANSLETRSPFLDHKLMEFAATIPSGLKVKGFASKYILKKALRGLLPRAILRRPKMGFGIPIAVWFRKELLGYLREVLLDESSIRRGYFQRQTIEKLIAMHVRGEADHSQRLWTLLCFELWHRMFIDELPGSTPPSA